MSQTGRSDPKRTSRSARIANSEEWFRVFDDRSATVEAMKVFGLSRLLIIVSSLEDVEVSVRRQHLHRKERKPDPRALPWEIVPVDA